MKLSKIDLASGLAYLAGGGLAGVSVGISTIAPQYAVKATAISGIVTVVSGLLLRLFYNPTATNTTPVVTANGGTVEVKTVAAAVPQNGTP